jgi:hypothetical protein
MHRLPTRARIISSIMLALAPATITLAPAAHATAGVTVTYASCGDTSFVATCEFTWTGGTSPFVVTWTPLEGLMGASGGSATVTGNFIYVGGNCVPQDFYEVKATITAADGSSETSYAGGRCE